MLNTVFCRGCGHSIHNTASVCPKCGAPQMVLSQTGEWGGTMAWVIGFAPIIGAFAETLIESIIGGGGSFIFLVTIAINIFLCTKDQRELLASGIDTAALGNVWLVPIYLFNRAKILNEKPAYAILWCVLFAAQIFGVL